MKYEKVEIPDGLRYALCAMSFFKSRCEKRPRFKKARRKFNINQTMTDRKNAVRLARKYIKLAREAGFSGSIRAQLFEIVWVDQQI